MTNTTTLTNVRSGGIIYYVQPPGHGRNYIPPTLPTDWQLIDGYLIGPTADLTDADLTDADLRGVNLTGANLTGANLEGANLATAILIGVQSGGITGTPSHLPADWQLINGYLINPTADLKFNLGGVNLTGADLTGANLSGADLNGMNLTDADLSNADLNGVDLSNAILIGVQSGGITGTPSHLPGLATY